MYFQVAYNDGDFGKISTNVSPFVKANLTFGLMMPKVRLTLTKPDMLHQKWCYFVYERF